MYYVFFVYWTYRSCVMLNLKVIQGRFVCFSAAATYLFKQRKSNGSILMTSFFSGIDFFYDMYACATFLDVTPVKKKNNLTYTFPTFWRRFRVWLVGGARRKQIRKIRWPMISPSAQEDSSGVRPARSPLYLYPCSDIAFEATLWLWPL